MQFTSDRVASLSLPMTIEMSKKARALVAEGKDIISLSLGEPDFDSPDFVKDAGIKGIEDNFSHYMPVPGYADLREAIVRKFHRDNGLTYQINEIVVSTGAKQSIANIVMATINPGDEVLIPAPYWVSYADLARYAGGVVVSPKAGLDQRFKITAEQLDEALTDRCRLMIFSSPNNPSGAMYSKEELESLAKVLERYPKVFVIADEIYEYIRYDNREHASMASIESMRDRVATINGLSKGFAMTGWRLGYMGAPSFMALACEKIQSQFTSGASSIAQRAAIAALDAGRPSIIYMQDAYTKRKDCLIKALQPLEHLKMQSPDGAFYLFVDISAYLDETCPSSMELAMHILDGGVATIPGDAFGLAGYLRISYATDEATLTKAGERIVRCLKQRNL